jgi:hypothetical protein
LISDIVSTEGTLNAVRSTGMIVLATGMVKLDIHMNLVAMHTILKVIHMEMAVLPVIMNTVIVMTGPDINVSTSTLRCKVECKNVGCMTRSTQVNDRDLIC